LKHDDYRYRFNADPACIRLTFSGTGTASKAYEWSATNNDAKTAEIRNLDKGKGCLEALKLFEQMIGEVVSQRNTSEFYEPEEDVHHRIENRRP
jgi:hypothetical protein